MFKFIPWGDDQWLNHKGALLRYEKLDNLVIGALIALFINYSTDDPYPALFITTIISLTYQVFRGFSTGFGFKSFLSSVVGALVGLELSGSATYSFFPLDFNLTSEQWAAAIVFFFSSWAMDSIKNRFSQSIFNKSFLKSLKIFGYKDFWRSDSSTQNRRFKGGDPKNGRKTLLWIIVVPPFFFDGWHFFKSILVGAFILVTTSGLDQFTSLSLAWIGAWWLTYDENYGTEGGQ